MKNIMRRSFNFLAGFCIILLFTACPDGPSSKTTNTVTVTFNANGASNSWEAPSTWTIRRGSSIQVPGQGNLARTGFTFGGWNTNSTGTGTNYNAGASIIVNNDITLWARWISSTGPGTEANPFQLTHRVWYSSSITSAISGASVWFSFPVSNGIQYRVWWNDSNAGDWTQSLDIMVTASYSDGTSIFTNIDAAWSSPQLFTANRTGTVRIRVQPRWTGNTGTFRIVYSEGTSTVRP